MSFETLSALRLFLAYIMKLFQYACIYLAVIFMEALACNEPPHCEKNKKYCATREKFRQKCPCTCKPDVSFAECCAHQVFEHDECREFCSFDVSPKQQRKVATEFDTSYNNFSIFESTKTDVASTQTLESFVT